MKELICIQCPLGCTVKAERKGDEIRVSGNLCARGESYARKELINPERILTTTVATSFPDFPRLPVRTAGEIPLEKIPKAMQVINKILIKQKIKIGDIIQPNLLNTGVDLVATAEPEERCYA